MSAITHAVRFPRATHAGGKPYRLFETDRVLVFPCRTMPSESPTRSESTTGIVQHACKRCVITSQHGDLLAIRLHLAKTMQSDGFAGAHFSIVMHAAIAGEAGASPGPAAADPVHQASASIGLRNGHTFKERQRNRYNR